MFGFAAYTAQKAARDAALRQMKKTAAQQRKVIADTMAEIEASKPWPTVFRNDAGKVFVIVGKDADVCIIQNT